MPGYHSVLPRVFPYRARVSREYAWTLIRELNDVHRDGYALTSHPSAADGHVHLWLSASNAEYLVSIVPIDRYLEKTE